MYATGNLRRAGGVFRWEKRNADTLGHESNYFPKVTLGASCLEVVKNTSATTTQSSYRGGLEISVAANDDAGMNYALNDSVYSVQEGTKI